MPQRAVPINDILVDDWTAVPEPPLWATIDEGVDNADSGDYITGQTLDPQDNATDYIAALNALIDPQTSANHKIRLIGAPLDIVAATITTQLRQGNNVIASTEFQPDSTIQEYTLTQAEADSITNYADLRIRLLIPGASIAQNNETAVWAVEFQVPDAPAIGGDAKRRRKRRKKLETIIQTAKSLAFVGAIQKLIGILAEIKFEAQNLTVWAKVGEANIGFGGRIELSDTTCIDASVGEVAIRLKAKFAAASSSTIIGVPKLIQRDREGEEIIALFLFDEERDLL